MIRQGVTIAIVGSRDFPSRSFVERFVDQLQGKGVQVVSGGAPGVDTWAVKRADKLGVDSDVIPAEWDKIDHPQAVVKKRKDGTKYNAVAGFWRNQDIVDAAEDGKSKGTKDTIDKALEAGLPLNIYVRRE